ncbi:MAG: hypothetical protein U0736_19580 [Gemmataceae bacterium]
MSEHRGGRRPGAGGRTAALVLIATVAVASTTAASGPIDAPKSSEPRVPVAKSLSFPGLMASEGTSKPFLRVGKGETLYSRDVLVALPGFKVDLEPTSKAVHLTLWGNLPGLSDSPALESSVVLHDSKAYDLDFTLLRGRVVMTNIRDKGEAKVWLRNPSGGIELVLPAKGDAVAIETYGRWLRGVPFSLKHKPGVGPVVMWEVFCLKGKVEAKASKSSWYMEAPPGPSYFHGNSAEGPATAGPERRDPPDWANPKAPRPVLLRVLQEIVGTYTSRLQNKDPDEVVPEMLAVADKLKDVKRATLIRRVLVFSLAALDEVDKVVELLETSPAAEVRHAAVIALRHWIGVTDGRDRLLYELLQETHRFSKAEAEALLQLLHSPFDPEHAETYETLIAYLSHRKQAVRELAHWHLVRLAPIGRDIAYDAAAPAEKRQAAVAEWKKRIPAGELPPVRPESTKKEPAK